ncbi:disulfide bond formation protein B [Tahibacter amnicola]|uniref:Disulfide bond formation protein B n=1 Tax=Tahibacter amnicola TaxID=2976241 RepID=A0ABY6BLH3_9GAMM|nr:disulfide bond formation protein B [Tahibacter amnicola]UXI70739.1 disulfide bond formation protein B [Tahibacter amnicola]
MNPFLWPFRLQTLVGGLACFALLGYALFAQYQLGKDPCPLCLLQRAAFLGMGIAFLVAALHGPRGWGRWIYATLVSLFGIVGALIAWRHIWLQNLPKDQVPACGPGLEYMLETFPLSRTFKMVFTGSGECAEVNWQFLGLSMPAWCLVWYVALTLLAIVAATRKSPAR